MPANFEDAFARVQQLATDFKANENFYLAPEYQEAEARRDFIDKFLIALGWDVNHERQKNPYQQEVKVERKEHGVSQRRADYAFYLAPNFQDVRFYVEAKKPYGDIATMDNYFQAIRYGWNSQTPIAALFDFEQFEILDCRFKPNLDTALQRNLKKFHYSQFKDKEIFGEIYWLFSREAVAGGSLEKYAASLPKRRDMTRRGLSTDSCQSMDEAFLEELDAHRDRLAHIFKNSNPQLDGETLTEVTQRTLDRLVFIRFLEDKLIEPQYLVTQFGERGSAWEDFIATSRRLDGIYNGIVFKKHDLLDQPGFKVNDGQFVRICEALCHLNSPYDFNAIPIHILGSIYERFLGKVIVATDKRVRVEEKPEVRKAGGVYYTPEYIVRYIVENTVGKLIEGKTPAQIAEMRFADIACGSGSFLLGVYDFLLRYHTKFYNDSPSRAKRGETVEREDGWHLSLQKKREILRNNIYGVDIDNQAVEVAQLSLFLKLLQDETPASARGYQMEFRETLLPPLNKNIVCGNSLIGRDVIVADFFENGDTERKLNPMDFEDAFPEIMKRGGFDVIVGNPPYVRIQGFPRLQLVYFSSHFQSARGNFDLYVSFIEQGFKLLKTSGLLGQIVPNKFFKTDYGEGLRKFILANKALEKVVDFGASQVFDATTYTCLLFLAKKAHPKFLYALSTANAKGLADSHFSEFSFNTLTPQPWIFAGRSTSSILDKITRGAVRLLDLPVEISRGSSTGNDEVFMVETAGCHLEPAVLRVPLFASDFSRYSFLPADKWQVIFPYKIESGQSALMTEKEFQKLYPKAFALLQARKGALLKRKQFSKWFGYSAPRNLPIHERAQICIPLLADRGLFALIPPNMRGKLCPMASGGFTIAFADFVKLRPEYVLGLLNSTLLFWRLRQTSNVFRGGWITCTKQYFGELPIRSIDFAKSSDKSCHDRMVSLVEQILAAKKQLVGAQSDKDKDFYEKKCAALDHQIDALVYELYGLTESEIEIIEETKS